MIFSIAQCNIPPKYSNNGPLKANQKLYPCDTKPKETTEPARVDYTYPDKVFFAMISSPLRTAVRACLSCGLATHFGARIL